MKSTNPLEVARTALKEQIAHHTAEIERLQKVLDQVTDAIPPTFADFGGSSSGSEGSTSRTAAAGRKK